jgi:hypothetical protein
MFKPFSLCEENAGCDRRATPQAFDRAVFIARGNRRSVVSQPDLNAGITSQIDLKLFARFVHGFDFGVHRCHWDVPREARSQSRP